MTQQSLSQTYTLRKPKLKKTHVPQCSFTIVRTWKQPKCPLTDEWIKKLWYIYIREYYSAIKRTTFESVLMRWMNLDLIIKNEVSQKEKDKYRILMHIWNLESGTKEFICRAAVEKQTQRTDLRTQGEERRGEGEMYRDSNMKTYIIICKIAKGNLLYVSGNSNRASVSTQRGERDGMGREMGERFKREGIYVYLWLIHIEV